jgi:hypothetical protein
MRIEAKLAGQRRGLFEPREWEWPDAKEMTLGELISEVVRDEVRQFRDRQAENRLLRILTPAAIAEGVERGKITSGGSEIDQPVDTEDAVATALEAFGDGFYFVFVDDQQIEDLEQTITVAPTSTLLFIRLMPLAGG